LVKTLVTLALAAGVAYLSYQDWRRTHECVWLARAERLPDFSPERAAALETAFEFEPMNPETAHDLGEIFRIQSFEGGQNYKFLAQTAMKWYARGMKLDRYDGYNYLRFGMCLDWLDRHDEAEPYFNRADALDPNGYYTAAHVGWHYVQTGDYSAARAWLERSLRLHWQENVTATSYLNIADGKLVESASGQSPLPAGF
jgi:tetratricopeptide (TPR) repeat protein